MVLYHFEFMLTYELSAVCDSCRETFSNGNHSYPDISGLIAKAWTRGWMFPIEDKVMRCYCANCATRTEDRKTSEAAPVVPHSPC